MCILWHFQYSRTVIVFKLSTTSTLRQADLFEEPLREYKAVSGRVEKQRRISLQEWWKDRQTGLFINAVQVKPPSWVARCISGEIKMSQRFTSLSLQAASLFSASADGTFVKSDIEKPYNVSDPHANKAKYTGNHFDCENHLWTLSWQGIAPAIKKKYTSLKGFKEQAVVAEFSAGLTNSWMVLLRKRFLCICFPHPVFGESHALYALCLLAAMHRSVNEWDSQAQNKEQIGALCWDRAA